MFTEITYIKIPANLEARKSFLASKSTWIIGCWDVLCWLNFRFIVIIFSPGLTPTRNHKTIFKKRCFQISPIRAKNSQERRKNSSLPSVYNCIKNLLNALVFVARLQIFINCQRNSKEWSCIRASSWNMQKSLTMLAMTV